MAPDSDLERLDPEPETADRIGRRTHPLSALFHAVSWAFGFAFAAGAGLGWLSDTVSLPLITYFVVPVAAFFAGAGFGLLSWAFRRYVIDLQEIRVDSGVLWRTSRRVPFERLQSVDIAEPLLARLFGLAVLQIESAGGGESRTSLSYVTLSEARQLRATLLDRAHRVQGGDDDSDSASTQDWGVGTAEAPRRVITVVPGQRLLYATALSLDFVFSALGLLIAAVAAAFFVPWWAVLGVAIPLATWIFSLLATRIIGDWNFTLSEGSRGLRIERGLLSRHSQTIPFDRVQGIRVEEPFVWRRFGWLRLRVDVAGYAGEASADGSRTNTTLLPITDREMADWVMERLIPGATGVPAEVVRPGTWWFAPIGWRFRSIGATDEIVRATSGWIYRTVDVVPHAKVQSVATQHGPLQRLKRVSTLYVHTPEGPVNARCRHLTQADAAAFAFAELERARAARA